MIWLTGEKPGYTANGYNGKMFVYRSEKMKADCPRKYHIFIYPKKIAFDKCGQNEFRIMRELLAYWYPNSIDPFCSLYLSFAPFQCLYSDCNILFLLLLPTEWCLQRKQADITCYTLQCMNGMNIKSSAPERKKIKDFHVFNPKYNGCR